LIFGVKEAADLYETFVTAVS